MLALIKLSVLIGNRTRPLTCEKGPSMIKMFGSVGIDI